MGQEDLLLADPQRAYDHLRVDATPDTNYFRNERYRLHFYYENTFEISLVPVQSLIQCIQHHLQQK